MKFPQDLQQGRLIKRYKRFLADVQLPDGSELTLHCPNTGSMKNCQEPGSKIWFTDSGNPDRKYPHTWQLIEVNSEHLVGINTGLANHLVEEALQLGLPGELAGFSALKREVPYGKQRSRIDILLTYPDGVECYVEIKNVSLAEEEGRGLFPDAVTTRGQKHLQELMQIREQGQRAVIIFCVQHSGVETVQPADAIDPEYGRLLRQAMGQGVEVFALGAVFDTEKSSIYLGSELPVLT